MFVGGRAWAAVCAEELHRWAAPALGLQVQTCNGPSWSLACMLLPLALPLFFLQWWSLFCMFVFVPFPFSLCVNWVESLRSDLGWNIAAPWVPRLKRAGKQTNGWYSIDQPAYGKVRVCVLMSSMCCDLCICVCCKSTQTSHLPTPKVDWRLLCFIHRQNEFQGE